MTWLANSRDCRVGFIPTAANVEPTIKGWLIGQMNQLQRYGFYQIDIVDISADGVDWQTRLADVDILWLCWRQHVSFARSGAKDRICQMAEDTRARQSLCRGSAGTIPMTPTIELAKFGDENIVGLKDLTGLGYVDFEVAPHCDMAKFERVAEYANTTGHPIYALDDLSAITVVDGKVEVWRHMEKIQLKWLYDLTLESRIDDEIATWHVEDEAQDVWWAGYFIHGNMAFGEGRRADSQTKS